MDSVRFNNLDKTDSFRKLLSLGEAVDIPSTLTPERIRSCAIPIGGGLSYNYAAKGLSEKVITLLSDLAEEQELAKKYRLLYEGEIMNTGEKRMVLHHLTRGQLGAEVQFEGKNLRTFYLLQQQRIDSFAKQVHNGMIKGSTGKKFDTVVQIGIGGSDLGPRALYLALQGYVETLSGGQHMKALFISNVDPDDPNMVLSTIDFETTLFILVSKSGTTQETLTNMKFVIEKMGAASIPGLDPKKHMIAVTSQTSPLTGSDDYMEAFFIDDFIGGRYSSTSAVGGTVLSLAFGEDVFADLLAGAAEADRLSLSEHPGNNAGMMDALIGVYERNILGLPLTAVLPYSQGLHRFPAHLQQLDMESNGKSVNRFGEPVSYSTGPVVFGEPGTNGQHSFYQLLHQGTDVIPLQFVGFRESQTGFDLPIDGSTSQEKLNANLAAQISAFAMGKEDENRNKYFPGNRPSSIIYGSRLTPAALGALLSHFENKVMFQGFLWNINSFDQEGVQLGKILTKKVLDGDVADPVLQGYIRLLSG